MIALDIFRKMQFFLWIFFSTSFKEKANSQIACKLSKKNERKVIYTPYILVNEGGKGKGKIEVL